MHRGGGGFYEDENKKVSEIGEIWEPRLSRGNDESLGASV